MAVLTKLTVNKADAYCSDPVTLTSGMSGAEIEFTFSSEWNGLGKTAVFRAGSTIKYVVLTSTNKCNIPYECLETARQNIVVGVYGTDGDDIIIPTVYCSLGLVAEGTAVTGSEPGAITQSLYNQVSALLTSTQTELADVKQTAIKSADATIGTGTGTPTVSVSYSWIDDADHSKGKKATFAFNNLKGAKGDDGDDGADGEDGISVTGATINSSGHLIITLSNSTTIDAGNAKGADGAPGQNGQDGADGEDGEDGFSPSVTIASISGGHSVTITDKDHPVSGQTFNVMDGTSGSSSWNDITDKPSTFPPSTHDHNSLYYGKSETDTKVNAKYTKPNTGIPKTDLASAVQTSLEKADSALQEHQSLSAYRTASAQDAIDANKQDKLPNSTNDKYLHTNASTGALEWATVQGGGGDIQVIDFGQRTLDTTSRYIPTELFDDLDFSKPIVLTNFYKKDSYNKNIDYTTTSIQSIIYYDSSSNTWKQELKIFNYKNFQITITSIDGDEQFISLFSTIVGSTVSQNGELLITKTISNKTFEYDELGYAKINFSYVVDTETITSSADYNYDLVAKRYCVTAPCCIQKIAEGGNQYYNLRSPILNTNEYLFLYIDLGSINSEYLLVDKSEDMTRIDMCKFTFKYKRRSSSSELGSKLANLLINADSKKQIMIYDFRLISSDNSSTNTCILSSVSEEGTGNNRVRKLSGVTTYNNISYILYITVNTTNIQEYRLVSNGITKIPFSGYTFTTSQKESKALTNYQNIIDPLFGASEDYRTISSERVCSPITLYGFKFLSSSDTRNNSVYLQYISTQGTISSGYYEERVDFKGIYTINSNGKYRLYELTLSAERNDEVTVRRYTSRDSGSFKCWRYQNTGATYMYVYTLGETESVGNTVYSDASTSKILGSIDEVTSSSRLIVSFGRIEYKATLLNADTAIQSQFFVTFIWDGEEWSADKSYSEILLAFNSGEIVRGKATINNITHYFIASPGDTEGESNIQFICFELENYMEFTIHQFRINNEDIVEYRTNYIPYAD